MIVCINCSRESYFCSHVPATHARTHTHTHTQTNTHTHTQTRTHTHTHTHTHKHTRARASAISKVNKYSIILFHLLAADFSCSFGLSSLPVVGGEKQIRWWSDNYDGRPLDTDTDTDRIVPG